MSTPKGSGTQTVTGKFKVNRKFDVTGAFAPVQHIDGGCAVAYLRTSRARPGITANGQAAKFIAALHRGQGLTRQLGLQSPVDGLGQQLRNVAPQRRHLFGQ
jgi:hypothetical protein